MEKYAESQGKALADHSLNELEELWALAKVRAA